MTRTIYRRMMRLILCSVLYMHSTRCSDPWFVWQKEIKVELLTCISSSSCLGLDLGIRNYYIFLGVRAFLGWSFGHEPCTAKRCITHQLVHPSIDSSMHAFPATDPFPRRSHTMVMCFLNLVVLFNILRGAGTEALSFAFFARHCRDRKSHAEGRLSLYL